MSKLFLEYMTHWSKPKHEPH